MCEQCSAKTQFYISTEEPAVLGYYALVRATVDGNEMKKDDWGLLTSNDPDFVFSTTPWPNPFFYLSEEQTEQLDNLDDKVFGDIQDKWYADAEKFAVELVSNNRRYWTMNAIAELTIHCLNSGMSKDTRRVSEWLFQHIGERLQKNPNPIPEATDEPTKT